MFNLCGYKTPNIFELDLNFIIRFNCMFFVFFCIKRIENCVPILGFIVDILFYSEVTMLVTGIQQWNRNEGSILVVICIIRMEDQLANEWYIAVDLWQVMSFFVSLEGLYVLLGLPKADSNACGYNMCHLILLHVSGTQWIQVPSKLLWYIQVSSLVYYIL